MENKKQRARCEQFVCEVTKDKHGYYTSCGMRVAFNKFFRYCPYCGRPIVKLFLMH